LIRKNTDTKEESLFAKDFDTKLKSYQWDNKWNFEKHIGCNTNQHLNTGHSISKILFGYFRIVEKDHKREKNQMKEEANRKKKSIILCYRFQQEHQAFVRRM
jgi:hypothetical protein